MCKCIYLCKRWACLCVGECSVHGQGKDEVQSPQRQVKPFPLLLTGVAALLAEIFIHLNCPFRSSKLFVSLRAGEAARERQEVHDHSQPTTHPPGHTDEGSAYLEPTAPYLLTRTRRSPDCDLGLCTDQPSSPKPQLPQPRRKPNRHASKSDQSS